jgi:peptide-methionine (R)-S-oxide reductase
MRRSRFTLTRKQFLHRLVGLATPLALPACTTVAREAERVGRSDIARLDKPLDEWRHLLAADTFRVMFEADTERPGSSALNEEHRRGTFICAACYLPLFDSATKYESGTGWPSFYASVAGRLGTERDFKLILPRTEYHCIRCGGHQGHRFKDGPEPTGERWCNNGVALRFIAATEPVLPLRT